jgi:hypothetical protein
MTDAPSATALPGAHGGARPRAASRGRATRRAIAGALGLGLLSLAHPPAADAQRTQVASARIGGRPTVPAPERAADAAAAPAAAVAPDPRLAPDEVVDIVLDALAQASDSAPDGGAAPAPGAAGPFALVFAFASPGNKAAVGSLERFEALVRDDAYRPLLHHRRAARGALRVDGDRATQRVVVTTARGDRVAYTFVLARQGSGAQRGCWLTESVTREAPSRLSAPFSA